MKVQGPPFHVESNAMASVILRTLYVLRCNDKEPTGLCRPRALSAVGARRNCPRI